MKIAVYTIALNEEQYVKKWFDSAKDADYLLIADTGSTDNTLAVAKSFNVNVVKLGVKPWRFDVARNAALAAIPLDVDYCIALDMDEVLVAGWREKLEKATTTRPRYQYTWSWNPDGTPGLVYGGDKIHARKGYVWKHPVHEVLRNYGIQETQEWLQLQIEHYPDNNKSRAQYLPLLEMAVAEDLHDDRNSFYLARELMFDNQIERAVAEFKRHLSLPSAVWTPERSAGMRYLAQCEPQHRKEWLLKAAQESNRRENHVALATYFYENSQWNECLQYCYKALEITEKPLDYLCEAYAWGSTAHDLAAISYYQMGYKQMARHHGIEALKISPSDERLHKNVDHYEIDKY